MRSRPNQLPQQITARQTGHCSGSESSRSTGEKHRSKRCSQAHAGASTRRRGPTRQHARQERADASALQSMPTIDRSVAVTTPTSAPGPGSSSASVRGTTGAPDNGQTREPVGIAGKPKPIDHKPLSIIFCGVSRHVGECSMLVVLEELQRGWPCQRLLPCHSSSTP